MIVADLYLNHPALRDPLKRVPDATVTWERSDIVDPETLRLLIWVAEEHCAALETALEREPSVTEIRRITTLDDHELYRVDQKSVKPGVYKQFVEEGCVIRKAVANADGWIIRATYSDRNSLSRFLDYCEQHDVEFELRRLLTEEKAGPAGGFGLTPQQREILVAAVEQGYFTIPRDVSLAELGDSIGISGNAASERLRRAMDALVRSTLLDTKDDVSEQLLSL